MRRHKTRGLAKVLAICASLCPACGDKAKRVSGQSARATVACQQACGLRLRIPKELSSPTCKQDCIARVVGSRAHCVTARLEWLECLATHGSGAAKGVDFDRRVAKACVKEEGTLEGCEAQCRLEGTLRSGPLEASAATPTATGSFELVHCGCEPCRPLGGAPEGAPCDSPKVCGERVVACDLENASVKVRLCLGGRCASGGEVFAATPQIEELRRCRREPR